MSTSSFYNIGSGLTDIDCTQVTTDYLITDDVNSSSGVINFNANNFGNVNLINGISINVTNARTLSTSNVAYPTSNVAYPTSNIAYPLVPIVSSMSNMSYAMSNSIYDAMAFSNASTTFLKSTINASSINSTNLVQCSNLNINNTILRINGSNLVDTDKKIDYMKWIKNGPTFSNDNTLAIAALSLAGATAGATLVAAGKNILDNNGNFANDALNELGDLMDLDNSNASGQSNKLYVNWKQITNRCIFNNNGSEKVGFGDDVLISSTKKLLGVNPSSLQTTVDTNGKVIKYIDALPSTYTVFDFNTKELFASKATLSNLTTSNVTISSNLTVPYINTATQVKVGNFYVRNDGIYVGDPVYNPFASTLVIDTNGFYKGTIDKSQVTNLEAFNLASAANGSLIWGEFGPTNTLNDPFNFVNVPLFNI